MNELIVDNTSTDSKKVKVSVIEDYQSKELNGKITMNNITQALKLSRAMKKRLLYLEGVKYKSCQKIQCGSNDIYCDCEYCTYYDELKCIQDDSEKA